MAKYLLLIYGDTEQWAAMSTEESAALDAAHAGHSGVEIRPVVDHS